MLEKLTTTYYPHNVSADQINGVPVYIPSDNSYSPRLFSYFENLYCKQLISAGFNLVRIEFSPWFPLNTNVIITNFDYAKLAKAKDEIVVPVNYDGHWVIIGDDEY